MFLIKLIFSSLFHNFFNQNTLPQVVFRVFFVIHRKGNIFTHFFSTNTNFFESSTFFHFIYSIFFCCLVPFLCFSPCQHWVDYYSQGVFSNLLFLTQRDWNEERYRRCSSIIKFVHSSWGLLMNSEIANYQNLAKKSDTMNFNDNLALIFLTSFRNIVQPKHFNHLFFSP